MNDAEIRADILDTAKGYVLKDRNSTYGSPEDNFKRIAILWEAYDQIRQPGPETPIDVSIKMILIKVARLAHNPTHKDSWVDTAGYAACGAGIALAEPQKGVGDINFREVSNIDGTTTMMYSGPGLTGKGTVTKLAQEAIYKVQAQQAVEQFQKACQTPSPSSGSPS